MYLLDTNVLSEVVKPRPDSGVVDWLDEVDEGDTYLSVVTISELRFGVARLALGRSRLQREAWLDETIDRFADRTLPIDTDVANAVGRVMSRTETLGRPVRGNDATIAATALWHQLTVVTRNVTHFNHTGVEILNPWELAGE